MKELIKLLERLMDEKSIVGKQVKVEDDTYFVYVRVNGGLNLEFSFYNRDEDAEENKEMLTTIINLIRYHVESKLPF